MKLGRQTVCTALVALAVVLMAAPVSAAFDKAEMKCRATIAKSGAKLSSTAAKTLVKCHRLRDKGRIEPATDCNDIATADTKGKVAKAETKLKALVGGAKDKCRDAATYEPLGAGALGYDACPAPCSAGIAHFGDVADCVACLSKATAEGMSEASMGSPAEPMDKGDAKCHGGIGKNQTKHYGTVLKERVKCQKTDDKGGETSTAACEVLDTSGKIDRSRTKAKGKISRSCAAVDLTNLDSCDDISTAGLKQCVIEDADERATALFLSFFTLEGGAVTTTTTTLPPTTTTTLPPQEARCPDRGELTIYAGFGDLCDSDADCPVGTCDPALGRCTTVTKLNTGITGIAHGGDINNAVHTRGNVLCPGPYDAGSDTPCGQCSVAGLDPSTGGCRCADDNRQICDEPFTADADDCGGGICNCYFGPPLPFSAGNAPACVVNRFAEDVSGTVNVDTGEGVVEAHLRASAYLGEIGLTAPCPYCTGDDVVNDGVRNGVCVAGLNDGESCDVTAVNTTFPAPGGDGHSIDCFPTPGKNISGLGLQIDLIQTTGTASMSFTMACGFPYLGQNCPCRQCTGDTSVPCNTDDDCAAVDAGSCGSLGSGLNKGPNNCTSDGFVCIDVAGDGTGGECPTGESQFCDGITRASGAGFIACQSDADCEPSSIGIDAGACALTEPKACFLDPIIAEGNPSPNEPIGAAVFCIPPTSNAGINGVAGLPGPGQIVNQSKAQAYCASSPNTPYQAGVGGCPDPGEVTWARVFDIVSTSCGSSGCHGGLSDAGGLGGLDDQELAYTSMMDESSQSGLYRVLPGDSTLSYLMHKLDGTQAEVGGFGGQMPAGGTLSDADRELIRAWIDAGAPE